MGLSTDRAHLEAQSLGLADELRLGKLAESAGLVRQKDLPDGTKSGLMAFAWGLLTAEVSSENLKKTLNFLCNRFYGEKLTLNYKVDGDQREYSIDYRDPAKLDEALATISKLETIRVCVQKATEE